MARNNRQPRKNNHPNSVKLLQRPDNGLGAFADASVDAFLMFDENLNLVSVNPAGEKLLGVSREADIGKNTTDIVPDIRRTGRYEKYLSVIETGRPFFAEDIITHPGFGDKHLSIKAFKVWHGVGMIVSDITERRRMEEALKESEKRFRAIFESAVDGMVLADSETRELYTANRLFCQMLGYSLEEIKNMGIKDLHPEEALPYVGQQFEKQVRGEIRLAKDIPVKRKDGSIFYAEVNSFLMTLAGKSYIMGMFRDISERKKAEEALRESELLATATIEGMSDAVMLVGMDGKVAYVNKAFEKMLGYVIEALVGTSAVELPTYHGSKDRKKARQALKRVIEKGSAEPIDMIALTKDGVEIPINFTASVVKDAKDNPKMLVAVIRDVTERRKAEESLRQSEEHFRALVENSHEAIVVLKGDGTISFGTTTIERMLGYTGEDLLGTGGFGFAHPDDMPKVMESFTHLMENPSSVVDTELRIQHKDGSWRIVEAVARNLLENKAVEGIVINWHDITERKVAEEALQASERRYRLLADNVEDVIWTADMNMRFTYFSPSVTRFRGYSVEEAMALSLEETLTPASVEVALRTFAEQMALEDMGAGGLSRSVAVELEHKCRNGSTVWGEVKETFLRDSDGRPVGVLGVARDVTERKKAEDALRRSEEYFRALMENSIDAVTIMDDDGTIRYESPSYERLLGFKPEERVGSNLFERIHPDDITRVAELFAEFLQNRGGTLHTEVRAQHKDGSWRSIEAIGSNLLDNPVVKGTVVNLRDITERKRMEEALQQSELNYRVLFDSPLDGLFVVDSETMKVVLANESGMRMAKIYGFDSLTDLNIADMVEFFHPEDRDRVIKTIAEDMFEKDLRQINEFRMLTKDGREMWISAVGTRTKYQGKLAGLVSMRDITERKQMEEELRRLSDAVKMTSESIAIADLKGRIVDINEAGLRMYGLDDRADLVGKDPFDIIVPEDQPKALENMSKIVEIGSVKDIEYHIMRKDGKKALIETSVSLIKGIGGKPKGLVAVARDITERRRMEEELAKSEAKYRSLIETAGAGVATTDLKGAFVLVNEALCNMLGYSREELVGKNFVDFLYPDDIVGVLDLFSRGLEGNRDQLNMEFRVIHKEGRIIWCYSSPTPLIHQNETIGFSAIIYDITQRKRAEEALRESEARYRLLAENVKDVISVVDMNLRSTYVSPSVTQLLGYTVEEAMAMSLEEGMTAASFEVVMKAFSEGLAMEKMGDKGLPTSLVLEAEAKHKDGHLVPIEMRVNLLRDSNGQPAGILGVTRDITERKKAEEVLRISEERYRLLVENANEFIVVAQDGMVKFFNSKVVGLLGYTREDLALKPFTDFIHPDDRQMVMERYLKRIVGGSPPPLYSFRVVDKTGNARWVEINAVVFMWEGRPATLNFLTDITERKKAEEEKQRMEEQLLLAGRLAAVGELSAGVAHELNNPLAAIQGFAQLLTSRNDLDETMKNDLGIVYREAQRAAKIIQNLLSFARKHEPEKQLISLNEVVEKTLELHAYQMKVNNIEVVVDFAADLPKTMADFFQMQQVFVNLVSNAEQAMVGAHGKGRLVVRTQKVGNMIQISFADDGPGIPEENMKRVFDPFFTTKEVGKGTGLGLSICYGLVEAHGGRIYARSKLGEGATFVVEIPIVLENQ